MFIMTDIIQKKKDGKSLTKPEIQWLVKGISDGTIPDYQLSAWAMAVYFKGMTEQETVFLTEAMAASGAQVAPEKLGDLSVDKHSTGGVGDKTTLIVTPIVASLGARVGKMSGRGLGHTGGTVDKLESIDGFRTVMSETEFLSQVENIGIAVIGQSQGSVPADKRLYALRDVTATVDSLPLIASSIMSKKIAAGAKSVVLDVKVGSGAFMKTAQDAEELAALMIKIGVGCGRKMAAVLTDMDTPLGHAVGNRLEVAEAISVLKNQPGNEDLREVCLSLSACMLSLCLGIPHVEGRKLAIHALESGKAYEKFLEWTEKQGATADWIKDTSLMPKAPYVKEVKAETDGYVYAMKADTVGHAAMLLGAGRATKDDVLDFDAGIVLVKKTGDRVNKGDTLALLYTSAEEKMRAAEEQCLSAYVISPEAPEKVPLVYKILN